MGAALERLLGAAGYRTTIFKSGEAMLEDESLVTADCFIFDVRLPGMSGFELHQRAALRGAVAPVIFVTAHDDAHARELAQASGAVAIFAKPFGRQSLLAAVAGALGPSGAVGGAA
jgi:FixJ family two-component response regulator